MGAVKNRPQRVGEPCTWHGEGRGSWATSGLPARVSGALAHSPGWACCSRGCQPPPEIRRDPYSAEQYGNSPQKFCGEAVGLGLALSENTHPCS